MALALIGLMMFALIQTKDNYKVGFVFFSAFGLKWNDGLYVIMYYRGKKGANFLLLLISLYSLVALLTKEYFIIMYLLDP